MGIAQQTTDNVVITGMGMVTSLGLDASTSCAAARAGLGRGTKLDLYPVRSEDDGSVDGVTAHAVPFVAEGFEGDTRLARLAGAAFANLRGHIPETIWKSGDVGFYMSIPDADRSQKSEGQGLEKKLRDDDRNIDWGRPTKLLQRSVRASEYSSPAALRWVTTAGTTGFAEALGKAFEDLASDQVSHAIVGGVDSLLDEATFAWLESTGRLKSPDIPSGLQPAEAAGFILLEKRGTARARCARIAGVVVAIHLAKEVNDLFSGKPSTGAGLSTVLERAWESASWTAKNPFWLVSDQNGERYRGFEWGNALFRLSARTGGAPPLAMWYPAVDFGETGSAFGVVAACVALSAFARKYAPATHAVLTASSEWKTRAAIVIAAPE